MKGWDKQALEGLPLRLLIMSLLISLAAPAVLGSMDSFERATTRSQLEAEASYLWRIAEDVVSAGEGNRRTITLSLPLSVDRYGLTLEVGGELNDTSSRGIRCCYRDAVLVNLILDDPPARITSSAGSALTLGSGENHLVVECQRSEGRTFVVVWVIE